MIIFNHIPRTGGTFLIGRLRLGWLGGGSEISLHTNARMAPRTYLDAEHRPALLVYHAPGRIFSRQFRRRPHDWVFTFLRDRVDMVYSNFAYMKGRILRGEDLPGWTEAMKAEYVTPVEDYVDKLLKYRPPDLEYPHNLDGYDFVGLTEHMDLSLAALGGVIGAPLTDGPAVNGVESVKTYRRDELVALFQPQLALYEAARQRLLSASQPVTAAGVG